MRFDPSLTVREALKQFYMENGFSEEDASKNYYKLIIGPFVGYVVNPDSRKKVVHHHDLEHILYEIDTSLEGEAELSAITMVTRGKKPLANYVYGGLGVLTGLVINRRRTLRGFFKGRKRKSVFTLGSFEELLDRQIGELRQELGILI